MSKIVRYCPLLVSIALVFAAIPVCAQNKIVSQPAPDATLYTSYWFASGYQNVSWIVCGSTQHTEGCYSSGRLGPFGKAGALIEGLPFIGGNMVVRYIYVVDVAAGQNGNGVKLYVYQKVDTITPDYDNVVVTLTNTVNLPLTGGSSAVVSMAANPLFLFIGTDQSPQAVEIRKTNLVPVLVGGFFPPINVTSITADYYGYVTVTFGDFLHGEDGFYTFGPDGSGKGDGGGAWFMLDTTAGLSSASLPPSPEDPEALLGSRLKVRRKAAPEQ